MGVTYAHSTRLDSPVPIYAFGEFEPVIHPDAYIHPDAVLIGRVWVGALSSIWPTAVLRGDSGEIRIGEKTSIQDGTVIHCTSTLNTIIGNRCVVGHNAHLEGAMVDDDVLIGSGSVVLHRVHVHSGSIVAAGAVLRDDTIVPPRSLAVGVPAQIKEGTVDPSLFQWNVEMYIENSKTYKSKLRRID
ncbi:MAG: hypothetical protein RIS09_518 [Actinomycetota bacterium]